MPENNVIFINAGGKSESRSRFSASLSCTMLSDQQAVQLSEWELRYDGADSEFTRPNPCPLHLLPFSPPPLPFLSNFPTIAAKKFKKLVGKETYSETLESTPTMEKEKFPQDYFPEVGQVTWIKHPSLMKQDWGIWAQLFWKSFGV